MRPPEEVFRDLKLKDENNLTSTKKMEMIEKIRNNRLTLLNKILGDGTSQENYELQCQELLRKKVRATRSRAKEN